MNSEICKKCKREFFINYSLSSRPFLFYGCKQLNEDTIYKEMPNEAIKKFGTIYIMNLTHDKKRIFNSRLFKFLEPHEDCPYYIEHQISKWNKK